MRKKTASEIKVGLLIALSLVILVLLLTNSANWRRGIGGKILKVRFDFVSNLQLGAPVHMSGVEIGRVIDIKLVEEGVEVTMRIKSPQPIRKGCVASIDFLGVVGETYVEIENGPLGNPPLPDKAVIRGRNPVSTATVLSKAEKAALTVMDMAQTALQAVRRSRSDLQSSIVELTDKLDKTLSLVNDTLASLQETSDELRTLASENRGKLANITSQVDRITQKGLQDYDEVLPQMKSLIAETRRTISTTSDQLEGAIAAVRDAARSLESTGQKLDERVKEMQMQLTGSSSEVKGKMLKELDSIHQTVEDLRKLSISIKTTSDELTGLLERIKSGKGTIGALVRSDETLRRAHDTMSQIERAARDTSDVLQALRSEVNSTGGLIPRWDAGIRYASGSSLISQLAFRLGDLKLGITMTGDQTGYDLQYIRPFHVGPSLFEARIGAIRSRAGAGFDWWWLSRKLGLTLDLSDSGSKTPRIDTYLRLRLLKGWCLSLGGEDIAGEREFSAGLVRETGGE
ncbi:MCE family protein [Candidatus Poribacteria bacterium]|nr:MCE family protein [Candidatus Poribacteria bacterium]